MAVEQIPEPNIKQADLYDWQKLIGRTASQGAGFLSIGLINIDNLNEPSIAKGSRLEVNHSFYHVIANDEIIGGKVSNGRNFIYAEPITIDDDPFSLAFIYDAAEPEWDTEKGGWYKAETSNRAVATFYYNVGQFQTKIILDSFNAMNNPTIRIPEWQRGFLKLNMSNMNNADRPKVLAGSIVEVDGALFEINEDSVISGSLASPFRNTYIIAFLDGNNLSFFFQTGTAVSWFADLNGWFLGYNTRRVVAKCYANNTYFNGKVIIDSFSAMSTIRTDTQNLTPGKIGDLVINESTAGKTNFINSAPGMYYYDIAGASSGTDNNGAKNNGETLSGWFVWQGGSIPYGVGQNGGNYSPGSGGSGGVGGAGGGGMSFVGPIIAHGGKPKAYLAVEGSAASGIYGGKSGNNGSAPNTGGSVKLWRCW